MALALKTGFSVRHLAKYAKQPIVLLSKQTMAMLKLGRSCKQALRLARAATTTEPDQAERVDHIINRLTIWTGAIGFFAPGSAGIEARFKDDEESREVVCGLLEQLHETSTLLFDHFEGSQSNRLHTGRPTIENDAHYGTPSEDGLPLGVNDSDSMTDDTEEIETIMIHIEETVDLMFRLLHLTRASANLPTRSRVLDFRAKHGSDDEDQRLESMLRWYITPFDTVEHMKRAGLPALAQNEVLANRLVSTALYRSWLMRYKERHAAKLAQHRIDRELDAPEIEVAAVKDADTNVTEEGHGADDTTSVPLKRETAYKADLRKLASVVYSDTLPSLVKPLSTPLEAYKKVPSVVSRVGAARRNRLPIPPAPSSADHGQHEVVCHFCWDVVGPEMLGDDEMSRNRWRYRSSSY